jgi:hypothetical protein
MLMITGVPPSEVGAGSTSFSSLSVIVTSPNLSSACTTFPSWVWRASSSAPIAVV